MVKIERLDDPFDKNDKLIVGILQSCVLMKHSIYFVHKLQSKTIMYKT
jgi:hypothetical protein